MLGKFYPGSVEFSSNGIVFTKCIKKGRAFIWRCNQQFLHSMIIGYYVIDLGEHLSQLFLSGLWVSVFTSINGTIGGGSD